MVFIGIYKNFLKIAVSTTRKLASRRYCNVDKLGALTTLWS